MFESFYIIHNSQFIFHILFCHSERPIKGWHGGDRPQAEHDSKCNHVTVENWGTTLNHSVFSATHLQNHVISWSQKKWRHKNIERQCKTTINSHEVYTKNHKQQYFWRISWIPKAHTAFDVVEGQREKTATMRVFNIETIESNDYDTFSDWHGPVFLFVYIYIFIFVNYVCMNWMPTRTHFRCLIVYGLPFSIFIDFGGGNLGDKMSRSAALNEPFWGP